MATPPTLKRPELFRDSTAARACGQKGEASRQQLLLCAQRLHKHVSTCGSCYPRKGPANSLLAKHN